MRKEAQVLWNRGSKWSTITIYEVTGQEHEDLFPDYKQLSDIVTQGAQVLQEWDMYIKERDKINREEMKKK